MTVKSPLLKVIRVTIPAVSTVGNDAVTPAFVAEFAGVITGVKYTPVATITGAATNNRAINLLNKGAAGSGSTVMAGLGFASGVNASAYVPKDITLSTTSANLAFAAGDVIAVQSLHVGTGIADPGGLVEVTIERSE